MYMYTEVLMLFFWGGGEGMVLGTRIGILRTIPLMLDLFRGLNFQLIIKNQTAQFLVVKYVPGILQLVLDLTHVAQPC